MKSLVNPVCAFLTDNLPDKYGIIVGHDAGALLSLQLYLTNSCIRKKIKGLILTGCPSSAGALTCYDTLRYGGGFPGQMQPKLNAIEIVNSFERCKENNATNIIAFKTRCEITLQIDRKSVCNIPAQAGFSTTVNDCIYSPIVKFCTNAFAQSSTKSCVTQEQISFSNDEILYTCKENVSVGNFWDDNIKILFRDGKYAEANYYVA